MDIGSVAHKGLRRFLERDDARGLQQDQVNRIRAVMTELLRAAGMDDFSALPGWRLHALKGDRAGTWSVSVSGNWRLTWKVVDGQIVDLDLEDYH